MFQNVFREFSFEFFGHKITCKITDEFIYFVRVQMYSTASIDELYSQSQNWLAKPTDHEISRLGNSLMSAIEGKEVKFF